MTSFTVNNKFLISPFARRVLPCVLDDDPSPTTTALLLSHYICKEGLPKVKLEQEGEESWEGSMKKVAIGSDLTRKYVSHVGLKLEVVLAVRV